MNARQTVEQTARDSYGRLLAYLAMRWRDLPAAEDALSDAFLAALEAWPHSGVPDKPEAWLLTAARRRLIDGTRRARVLANAAPALLAMAEEAQTISRSGMTIPDERLQMLFLCAHPAIDPVVHTPLMLQTVLGLDAGRIASAFVIKPCTMGQRLSRAKAKMRKGQLQFELPDAKQLPQRLDAVLEAVYAAYGSGWEDLNGVDPRRKGLAEEALCIGRLLLRFMPAEPEVQGLMALMLHCEARRSTRRNRNGRYIPLAEQDPALWSRSMITEAEQCLALAAQADRIGRFQLLAAIQSIHAQRAWTGRTEWEHIALLYEGLVHHAPTIGTFVGRAAAVAEARGAEVGLAMLEAIPAELIADYQPYWALLAHLYKQMQKQKEAQAAYSRAIGLCSDPSVRQYLKEQLNHI